MQLLLRVVQLLLRVVQASGASDGRSSAAKVVVVLEVDSWRRKHFLCTFLLLEVVQAPGADEGRSSAAEVVVVLEVDSW